MPGNLLLAGEYAVTEEGGLGITLGVEPRITLTANISEHWLLEGFWPGGNESYSPGETRSNLLSAVWNQFYGQSGPPVGQPWHLKVDSTAFFDLLGRKKGFGSSAATAAVVTAALLVLQNTPRQELAHKAFLPAVKAHRFFQGGKGSGYDVAASLFGQTGIFTGGEIPQWTPISLPPLQKAYLCSGPQAVRTVSALASYDQWKITAPEAARIFQEKNNQLIQTLTRESDLPRFWDEIQKLSMGLGNSIGVSADLPQETKVALGLIPGNWKCLGAGNELVLTWNRDTPPHRGDLLKSSKEGIKWE